MTELQEFLSNCKLTPAGYISKKDVNRFLTFIIFAYSRRSYTEKGKVFAEIQIPEKIKIYLFKKLNASRYYTFTKIDDSTYTFQLPKIVKHHTYHEKLKRFIISKKGVRFITKPLISYIFNEFKFTSLRRIDRFFRTRGFTDTSIKVFKQVSFEFIPLHQAYTKDITVDSDTLTLYLNKWITSKPYTIESMLKRKLSYMYPDIKWYLDDTKLVIIHKDPELILSRLS